MEAVMVTSYLAHVLPAPGKPSQRLNDVSPNAILPADWPPQIVSDRLPFDAFSALALVALRANGRQIPVIIGRDIRLELAYSLAEQDYVQNVAGECWATSLGLAYVHARALDWSVPHV